MKKFKMKKFIVFAIIITIISTLAYGAYSFVDQYNTHKEHVERMAANEQSFQEMFRAVDLMVDNGKCPYVRIRHKIEIDDLSNDKPGYRYTVTGLDWDGNYVDASSVWFADGSQEGVNFAVKETIQSLVND